MGKLRDTVGRVLLSLLGACSCIATVEMANAATICVGPVCLVELTFDEVSFGDATLIEPLPPTTYQQHGVLFNDFLWGKDSRDPFGGDRALVAGLFGQDPTVEFLTPTPFVGFHYWTVDDSWQIQVIAFNASNVEVGSFIDSGLWSDGGGSGGIVGPFIDHLSIKCREAQTGIAYGCGAVALSTLIYITVAEPATLALLSLALAGLGFARRRKLH